MEHAEPLSQQPQRIDLLKPWRQLGSRIGADLLFAWHALRVVSKADLLADDDFKRIYGRVFLQTLTSIENLHALYRATAYVATQGIEGDLVECGVWRGGSSMTMALALLSRGNDERTIHLYDTFAGMTQPSREDGIASALWSGDLLDAPLSLVRRNMLSTGYPPERVVFVEGPVEETLPHRRPESIALLRLDTDFYESTYSELCYLYPLLTPGGVLLIDDYALPGCRKAVDRYFQEHEVRMLLHRIDFSARLGIKPSSP